MTIKDFYIITEYLNDITKDSKFYKHIFAVGGAIRDLVMENEIKDIDIVLDIKDGGIELAQWLWKNDYLVHVPVTYPTYGTWLMKFAFTNSTSSKEIFLKKIKEFGKNNKIL